MKNGIFLLLGSSSVSHAFAVALLSLTIGAAAADAASINFAGSGTGANGEALSATAHFTLTGNTLTLTLKNTYSGLTNNRPDVLTAFFFDTNQSIINSLTSVVIPEAQKLFRCTSASACSSTTVGAGGQNITGVAGSWQYVTNTGTVGTDVGLGTVGLDIFGDFVTQGSNGPNYGLIGSGALQPNGSLRSSSPNDANANLVQSSLVFTFNVANNFSLFDISNVRFQYGTNLAEPNFSGTCIPAPANICTPPNPDPVVPEPSPLFPALAMGLCLGGAVLFRRTL